MPGEQADSSANLPGKAACASFGLVAESLTPDARSYRARSTSCELCLSVPQISVQEPYTGRRNGEDHQSLKTPISSRLHSRAMMIVHSRRWRAWLLFGVLYSLKDGLRPEAHVTIRRSFRKGDATNFGQWWMISNGSCFRLRVRS